MEHYIKTVKTDDAMNKNGVSSDIITKNNSSNDWYHAPTESSGLLGVTRVSDEQLKSEKQALRTIFTCRALFVATVALIVVPLVVIVLVMQNMIDITMSSKPKSAGIKVRFKAINGNENVHVRLDTPNHKLVYGETYSRYQSSTFEMFTDETKSVDGQPCFRWKSLNGKWLYVDYDNTLSAKASSYFYADSFYRRRVDENDPSKVKLILCGRGENRYLAMTYDSATSRHYLKAMEAPKLKSGIIAADLKNEKEATIFELANVPFYRGVNFGGWFIPEVWMLSSFFNGTGLGWGGSLCAMMNYSSELTESRMNEHLRTWITEADFQQVKAYGFNSIRLPIGYWNIIRDPFHRSRYAPQDLATSLRYIDWTFEMATKYDLTILLDLHGGPGSQNGQDHSGCGYSIMMPEWSKPHNINLSLRAIEAMVKRYIHHPKLIGIELMNEPSELISLRNHTVVKQFYENAYRIIRQYSNETVVIFNELYEHMYGEWDRVMIEPRYFNVVVDFHLYDWMAKMNDYTKEGHIRDAKQWSYLIEKFSVHHPIVIGEWCMSTGTKVQAGQEFVTAAVESFHTSFGWYMWNWKIEPKHPMGFYEWDVQWQMQHDRLSPFKTATGATLAAPVEAVPSQTQTQPATSTSTTTSAMSAKN